MRPLLSGILVFWLSLLTSSAQVDVRATLDSTHIVIGDQVQLEIFVSHTPGVQMEEPDFTSLDTMQAIEVLQRFPWDTVSTSPEYVLRRRLVLTSFEPGEHVIPAIRFPFRQNNRRRLALTEAIRLLVTDIPPAQDPSAIMPIKPIIEEPFLFQDLLPYLLAALGFALIILGALFFWRRRRQATAPPSPAVVLPPHEVALQKLKDLKGEKRWQKGDIKGYQSELSYILREYLENRFRIPALEMTSTEITTSMSRDRAIETDWTERLQRFFQMADLVKFAKAEPPPSIHEEAWEEVRGFVEATIPPPEPEEQPEAPGTEAPSIEN